MYDGARDLYLSCMAAMHTLTSLRSHTEYGPHLKRLVQVRERSAACGG